MKHVFVIHSNITLITACKIIDYERISHNDVVFCLSRGFEVSCADGNIKVVTMPEQYTLSRNVFRNSLNRIRWVDEFNNLIKHPFIAYLPHTHDIKFALIVSCRLCKQFSYMEEGLASYVEKNFIENKLTKLQSLFRLIYYGSKYMLNFMAKNNLFVKSHKKFLKCYALNEWSFENSINRVVLELRGDVSMLEGFDCVIIFDSLSIFNFVSLSEILGLLVNNIFQDIENCGLSEVAFKLHPEHSNSLEGVAEAAIIRQAFKNFKIKSTELDKSFSVEEYLQSHKTRMYTFISSLGFYASIFGSESISLYSRLNKINPKIYLPEKIARKMIQL